MSDVQALSTAQLDDARGIPTKEFVATCHTVLIPVNEHVSYFSVEPLDDKERQRLVFDPISALPPAVLTLVPNLRLVLVPYLASGEDTEGAEGNDGVVRIRFSPPPAERRWYSDYQKTETEHYIFLAIRSDDYFDAHVLFYQSLASRIMECSDEQLQAVFNMLVDIELKTNARGEVNEFAWQRKKDLLSLAADAEDKQKYLDEYRDAALADTLTLYLHGLCCDIDLDSGPKQLASKHIRTRLQLLKELLPPPDGVALFPDELGTTG